MAIDKNSKVFTDLCGRFELDPKLVGAIITVESTWNTYAYRFEPGFNYLVRPESFADAQGFSQLSERILQKSSLGLMQVMGGTARWMGFDGYLPRLFEPAVGMEWGMRYLVYLRQRYKGSVPDMIAAYNAGNAKRNASRYANQDYVDRVLGVMREA